MIGVPVAACLAFTGVAAADHIAGTSCGRTQKCADHQYYPKLTLKDVQTAPKNRGATLVGRKDRSNQLLGYHGSDTLIGGDKSDVLWADHVGTGQPASQFDRITGGDGTDFIYSSKGTNAIDAGPGNDVVKIRYGRGTLDCGPGRDIINLPRSRDKKWKIVNCEKIDRKTEKARGGGLKPLP